MTLELFPFDQSQIIFYAVEHVLQSLRQNSKYAVELSGDSHAMSESSHNKQQLAKRIAAVSRDSEAQSLFSVFGWFGPRPFIRDFTPAASCIEEFLNQRLENKHHKWRARTRFKLDSRVESFVKPVYGPISEHPFVRDLLRLFSIASDEGARFDDGQELLRPFCAILEAGDTTGPLTGAALEAIEVLVRNGLLDNCKQQTETLVFLSTSLSNCKFETSDLQQDEIVLARLLHLITSILQNAKLLACINNKSICELIETAFGICFQVRASTLLKNMAQDTLSMLIDLSAQRFCELTALVSPTAPIFDTLTSDKFLPSNDAESPFGIATAAEVLRVLLSLADVKDRPQHAFSNNRVVALYLLNRFVKKCAKELSLWLGWGKQIIAHSQRQRSSYQRLLEKRPSTVRGDILTIHTHSHSASNSGKRPSNKAKREGNADAEQETCTVPSPVGSIKSSPIDGSVEVEAASKVEETVVSEDNDDTASSNSQSEAEKEKEGNSIAENELQLVALNLGSLVEQELFRLIFFVLKSTESLQSWTPNFLKVCAEILRLSNTLYPYMFEFEKPFYAWLVDFFIAQLDAGLTSWDILGNNSKSAASETSNAHFPQILLAPERTAPIGGLFRELIWTTLLQWSNYPDMLCRLYAKCDADLAIPSVVSFAFVHMLARHSFPDTSPQGSVTMPVHQQYAFGALFNVLESMYLQSFKASGDDKGGVSDKISKKLLLHRSAIEFNTKPKVGIAFLVEHKVISSAEDYIGLVNFLKSTPGVSKKQLGDYISRPEQVPLLKAFIGELDFAGKRIDEALRVLLELFRLPGESQQIGRILEMFSEQYFAAAESSVFANADAAYVLSYSIIMLNTDQHNPHVRKPMTVEEFTRNLRGVNDGQDFDAGYMSEIYNNIRHNEIVMPGEQVGTLIGLRHSYRELFVRSTLSTNIDFDAQSANKEIFACSWRDFLCCMSYYFDTAEDDANIERAAVGCYYFSKLCELWHMREPLHNLVILLGKSTGVHSNLSVFSFERLLKTNPANTDEPLDAFNIDMGSSQRQQLALQLYFRIFKDFHNALGLASFEHFAEMMQILFFHNGLGRSVTESIDETPPALSLLMLLTKPHAAQKLAYQKLLAQHIAQSTSNAQKRSDGLFSTLSQLISMTASGFSDKNDLEQAVPDEVAASQHFTGLLESFKLSEICSNAKFESGDALCSLLLAFARATWSDRPFGNVQLVPAAGLLFTWMTSLCISNMHLFQYFHKVYSKHVLAILDSYITSFFVEKDASIAVSVTVTPEQVQTEQKQGIPSLTLLELVLKNIFRLYEDVNVSPDVEQWRWGEGRSILMRLGQLPAVTVPVLSPEPFFVPFEVSSIVETLQTRCCVMAKVHRKALYSNKVVDCLSGLFQSARGDPRGAQPAFDGLGNMYEPLFTSDFEEYLKFDPDVLGLALDAAMGFISAPPFERVVVEIQARLVQAKSMLRGQPRYAVTLSALRDRKRELLAFALQRALKALEWISKLCPTVILHFGKYHESNPERLWYEYWLRVLTGLGQQLCHPFRDIRQQSVSMLQRFLLSNDLFCESGDKRIERDVVINDCFEHVLFPVLEKLLEKQNGFYLEGGEPEDSVMGTPLSGPINANDQAESGVSEQQFQQRMRSDLDEMQARIAGLVCKVFMHHVPFFLENLPASMEKMTGIWVRILSILARFLKIGAGLQQSFQSDYLYEAILECLKNMLLVMHAQNVFANSDFFQLTLRSVGSFIPGLLEDVFGFNESNVPESLPCVTVDDTKSTASNI